mgnify:CR=1 FL=1
MDDRARQHQLHLVVVAGVDQQLPIGQLARHHVRARRRDDHAIRARLSTRSLHAGRIARQRDDGRGRRIIGSVKVALGIVRVKGAFIERRRNLLERCVLRVGSACRSRLNTPMTAMPAPRLPLTRVIAICTISGSSARVTTKFFEYL